MIRSSSASRSFHFSLLCATTALVGVIMPTSSQAADSSGWTTTKVAQGTAGGYCAVSRPVDDIVVTVGRSAAQQSSLALEFMNGKFDAQKTYRLSIKPGDGERLDIESKPISAKTFVLNLDQVVDLDKSFTASPTLQVRYDDQSLALALPNWDAASKSLSICVTSLNDSSVVQVSKPEPVAVGKKETKPEPVKVAQKEMPKAVPVSEMGQKKTVPNDMMALQDENKRLADALRQTRTELETARQSNAGTPAVELQEKIKLLQSQNADLQVKMKDATKPNAKSSPVDNSALATLRTERDALQADLKKARDELNTLKTAQKSVAPADKSMAALQAQLDTMAGTNKDLRVQLESAQAKIAATPGAPAVPVGAPESPDMKKKISDLQAQVDTLSDMNAVLQGKLATARDTPKVSDRTELEQKIEQLAAENVRLRGNLSAATNPAQDMKVSVAAELPLRQQLRALRNDNDTLRARNDELLSQLEKIQRGGEIIALSSVRGSKDIEQAMRRSQEAEREVQRLSIALREDRAKCSAEKKDIEYMLFDPKLAKDGQIALLNSLEDELATLRSHQPVASVQTSAPVMPASMAQVRPTTAAIDDVAIVPSAPVANDANQVRAEPLAASADVAQVGSTVGVAGLTNLLRQAGVAVTNTIAPAPKNPFGGGAAWRWEAGELAGLAVQQTSVRASSFDSTVSQQIDKLKSACKGDFAVQPVTSASKGLTYAAYDAACIAGANSTSAAVLFYQKDGMFNVISNEAAPDDMDKAMDARDKILTTLGG
jgi:hypothetical protein